MTESTRAESQRPPAGAQRPDPLRSTYAGKHLRFGWWALFAFATLGMGLELLHGFKVQMYLAVSNETRLLLWTLARAHRVLLPAINIIFALGIDAGRVPTRTVRRTSTVLIIASLLLPGGFFAAGVAFYDGDSGIGVAVVPVG